METFTISLQKMRIYAYHGVLEQERTVGNEYEVTVKITIGTDRFMELSRRSASIEKRLQSTVDYSKIADIVRQQMAVPTPLLEAVALRIRLALKARIEAPLQRQSVFVDGGLVEIVKLTPPLGVQCAGASVLLEW